MLTVYTFTYNVSAFVTCWWTVVDQHSVGNFLFFLLDFMSITIIPTFCFCFSGVSSPLISVSLEVSEFQLESLTKVEFMMYSQGESENGKAPWEGVCIYRTYVYLCLSSAVIFSVPVYCKLLGSYFSSSQLQGIAKLNCISPSFGNFWSSNGRTLQQTDVYTFSF